MAVLKTIKQKEKEYIFKSFDNDKSGNPSVAVFRRFPFSDEIFPVASQKNVLESSIVKEFDNTQKAKEKLVEHIINVMVSNITANRIDYHLFLNECIEQFNDLIYEDKEIKSVKDFLTLPQEAVHLIAQELYLYAKTEDEFTMEQKKI
jgi:hypothetical protein